MCHIFSLFPATNTKSVLLHLSHAHFDKECLVFFKLTQNVIVVLRQSVLLHVLFSHLGTSHSEAYLLGLQATILGLEKEGQVPSTEDWASFLGRACREEPKNVLKLTAIGITYKKEK